MTTRNQPDPDATPRRILVPVDGDPPNGAVFDYATALAAALDAELLLGITAPALALDPVPPPAAASGESAADQDSIEDPTRARLLGAQRRVPPGVRSRAVLGWAPLGPAIVDTARDEAADLVVVSKRRGGRLSHLLRDGADHHVLDHSPVPVLVVPRS